MLVGYMRVSSESDRQKTNQQRDALLAAGIDTRHLYEDRASGAKDDRPGLAQALEFLRPRRQKRGRESFLDSITTVSVEDRPCLAAHASLLETSRIMS